MFKFWGTMPCIVLVCWIFSLFTEHDESIFGGLFFLTLIYGFYPLIKPSKPSKQRFIRVNRDRGPEKLRGKILCETPFSYFVQFNTFTEATWDEAIPKKSKEILEIWEA
jgi:hypothetical protein